MSEPVPREERARISACLPDQVLPAPPSTLRSHARGRASTEVELLANVSRSSSAGCLQLRELAPRNMDQGVARESYRSFLVERSQLDAVATVLFRRTEREREIFLRTQLRPPLCFRPEAEARPPAREQSCPAPLHALGTGAVQWEIPAGSIESGARGLAGLFSRASTEALEEVGVVLPASRFRRLGLPCSPSPGLIAEKLHFVCAEILDTDERRTAEGDGHVVEQHARSLFVPLSSALRSLDQGQIHDLKTEVAIQRLRDLAPRMSASQDVAR